jgi:hypothetical protein
MYSSPAEALESTLSELPTDSLYRISRLSGPDVRLANGIRYCYVEVTTNTGTQYGIEAFDEEAEKLYRSASRIQGTGHAAISPLLLTVK